MTSATPDADGRVLQGPTLAPENARPGRQESLGTGLVACRNGQVVDDGHSVDEAARGSAPCLVRKGSEVEWRSCMRQRAGVGCTLVSCVRPSGVFAFIDTCRQEASRSRHPGSHASKMRYERTLRRAARPTRPAPPPLGSAITQPMAPLPRPKPAPPPGLDWAARAGRARAGGQRWQDAAAAKRWRGTAQARQFQSSDHPMPRKPKGYLRLPENVSIPAPNSPVASCARRRSHASTAATWAAAQRTFATDRKWPRADLC